MMNGVTSGSIIIVHHSTSTQSLRGSRVEQFELQTWVRLLESYLLSGRNPKSTATLEHQRAQAAAPEESILFDWPLLVYTVAAIKSASAVDFNASATLADEPTMSSQSPEVLNLAEIRHALRSELNVYSDAAARQFLVHLHSVGLLRRTDQRSTLITDPELLSDVICGFAFPLLLDTSVDVETLVAAIEAGLEDINLSVNESALLLLTRRCWPSIWASEYGLKRLAQALLSWICTEVQWS